MRWMSAAVPESKSDCSLLMQGWYYDGTSSVRHEVILSPLPNRLEIRGVGELPDPLSWPFDKLRWAQPPNAQGRARLALQGDHAARLELDNPEYIAAIRQAYPAIDKAGKDQGGRRKLAMVVGISVASIGIAVFAAATILPPFLAPLIPASIERAMGEATVEQVIDLVGLLEKKKIAVCPSGSKHPAMERFRQRLASAAGINGPLTVTVVNAKMINAFAAPGGQIVVFRGLIDFVHNPEELAGVMAHEIGHLIHLHPTKGLIRHIGLTGTLDLLLAGGGQGIMGTATGLMLRSAYSRDAEREADDAALQILQRANIQTSGVISVFKRFSTELPELPKSLKLFSSHPLSKDRAVRLSAQATKTGGAAMSAKDWKSIQNMCGASEEKKKKQAN
jgi:beta-barrel assembly-enhancing protease